MSPLRRRGRAMGLAGRRGQSLVEYAATVPVFLLILLGLLEFGFAFSHHLTMEYASREGARVGSALANGTDAFPCANVDDQVIAAVQRVLVAAGSQIDLDQINEIRIYQANNADGNEGSAANIWRRGNGPTIPGESQPLKFARASGNWSACSRLNGANPDSIGVSVSYTYRFVTPLASLMRLAGAGQLTMTDRTVMALNPTVP